MGQIEIHPNDLMSFESDLNVLKLPPGLYKSDWVMQCLYDRIFLFEPWKPDNRLVDNKSRKEGKNQEPIQSSTTPDPGHRMGKWQNTGKHNIQESQWVTPFPASDHKAAIIRQDSMVKTNTTHK